MTKKEIGKTLYKGVEVKSIVKTPDKPQNHNIDNAELGKISKAGHTNESGHERFQNSDKNVNHHGTNSLVNQKVKQKDSPRGKQGE